jgi:hypothetical protein
MSDNAASVLLVALGAAVLLLANFPMEWFVHLADDLELGLGRVGLSLDTELPRAKATFRHGKVPYYSRRIVRLERLMTEELDFKPAHCVLHKACPSIRVTLKEVIVNSTSRKRENIPRNSLFRAPDNLIILEAN